MAVRVIFDNGVVRIQELQGRARYAFQLCLCPSNKLLSLDPPIAYKKAVQLAIWSEPGGVGICLAVYAAPCFSDKRRGRRGAAPGFSEFLPFRPGLKVTQILDHRLFWVPSDDRFPGAGELAHAELLQHCHHGATAACSRLRRSLPPHCQNLHR